jgi:hypothetical protein
MESTEMQPTPRKCYLGQRLGTIAENGLLFTARTWSTMDTQCLAKQQTQSVLAQSSSPASQQGFGHCYQDAQVLGPKETINLMESAK